MGQGSWKLVESGPRLEKGGAVVGDEEGVGMRVGPESELQHVELWAQRPVDGAERTT